MSTTLTTPSVHANPGATPGATPAEHSDRLLDHEYDGIQEYDNPTPGWWHGIFLVSIIFSVFYMAFFHTSPMAWSVHDQHAAAQAREFQRLFAQIGELAVDEPTILKMKDDSKWMAVAAGMFRGKCASCHGADGQGLVGPNMTDDSYKNVKTLLDIPRVITEGAANGAMPAWKVSLSTNEVVLLSSYVAGLRGKNLPGRAPEGEAAAPWVDGG
jgi:cytochrome c oxidase cbb3-type subunit 3